jgi:hypothetical protein
LKEKHLEMERMKNTIDQIKTKGKEEMYTMNGKRK